MYKNEIWKGIIDVKINLKQLVGSKPPIYGHTPGCVLSEGSEIP